MDYLASVMAHSSGHKCYGETLEDEMKQLGNLRTAIMMAKCRSRDEAIAPRKRNTRSSRDHNELKVVADPDIVMGKASPPYYAGSPPIRASNPLIRDTYFQRAKGAKQPP